MGYQLVGDNLDKGVRARYMRSQSHHDQSLHYFNSFAVYNRIDFSSYPDIHPSTCFDIEQNQLPSRDDDDILRESIATIISRVLTDNMPFFRMTFDDVILWHMKHKYYSQMSKKYIVMSVE